MMKKLLVTVFALSFTALGCGSDDGGKKDAALKLDTQPGVEVQPQTDVPITKTDVPVPGPEVQVDKPIGPEVQAVEAHPAVEGGIDQSPKPVDTNPPVDGGTVDAPIKIDGAALDTQKLDVKAVDSGLDTGSAG